jgi:ElaB/YqjD/DUF883 family membrane-anchored ribosome-binding protein
MYNATNTTESNTHGQDSNRAAGPTAMNAISAVPSAISRELHNFLADIEDLIKDTTSLSGEELAQARDKLNERIAKARASVEAASESVVQRARHTADVTNEYVHEKPWVALGAGAALAFLVGVIIARRS